MINKAPIAVIPSLFWFDHTHRYYKFHKLNGDFLKIDTVEGPICPIVFFILTFIEAELIGKRVLSCNF
jgi:hypothetical protein